MLWARFLCCKFLKFGILSWTYCYISLHLLILCERCHKVLVEFRANYNSKRNLCRIVISCACNWDRGVISFIFPVSFSWYVRPWKKCVYLEGHWSLQLQLQLDLCAADSVLFFVQIQCFPSPQLSVRYVIASVGPLVCLSTGNLIWKQGNDLAWSNLSHNWYKASSVFLLDLDCVCTANTNFLAF